MSAFGENRYGQLFGAAVRAAGVRLNDKLLSQLNNFAWRLSEVFGGFGLENIFLFCYPFVGGTAVTHSFNLANPAVGRITWSGTITHNANGITGGGGRGNTGVKLPGTTDQDCNVVCGTYCRTSNAGAYNDIGNRRLSDDVGIRLRCRAADTYAYFNNSDPGVELVVTSASGQGFWRGGRDDIGNYLYHEANQVGRLFEDGGGPATPLVDFYILDDGTGDYSINNLAFAFCSQRVDTIGVAPGVFSSAFYNAVQAFQTQLGRNVGPIARTPVLVVNNGTGDGTYAIGAVVAVAAGTPPIGEAFMAWTGDIEILDDSLDSTTNATMGGFDAVITATFAPTTPTKATFIVIGTKAENGSGSLTLNAPGVQVVGDLWIAIVAENTTSGTGQTFAGWTPIFNGGSAKMSAWYFVYNGTMPNRVVGRSYPSGIGSMLGAIFVVRGANNSSPVNALGPSVSGSTSVASYLGVTTTGSDCLVILVDATRTTAAITRTGVPAGTSKLFEDASAGTQNCFIGTAGNADNSLACSAKAQAVAGPTGDFTNTLSVAGAWEAQLFAIK